MYQLIETENGLELNDLNNVKELPIRVDFADKSLQHRAKYLLHSKDGLVKAIHKPRKVFRILDATAGLGTDAFLLATLGHELTLCERSLPISQLLSDGLQRAAQLDDLAPIVNRMHLIQQDSIEYLQNSDSFDIIYCDPMFPMSQKSRLVRKSMRALHHMVGLDMDAGELLTLALKKATQKVVVKRPRLSLPIGPEPSHAYEYQACRFDVYIC